MNVPVRIQLSRRKGFRLPANAVNVARPGKWGNPFVVGRDGTRLQCCAMFLVLARGFIVFDPKVGTDVQLKLWQRITGPDIAALAGRDLACWCRLDGGPCHADILLCLANPGHPAPAWFPGGAVLSRVRIGMKAVDIIRNKRKAAKASA